MAFNRKRLIELREEAELTQDELAKAIKFSKKQIGAWEQGDSDPRADSLVAIAMYFHVSVDWLLDLSKHRTEQSRGGLTPLQRKYLNAFERGDVETVVTMVMDKLRDEKNKRAGE